MTKQIKRALISVSDKTNLLPFAKKLHQCNIEILSTGGTAKVLSDANIPVIEVSDYTGFPEMMAGRIKTLHPKIHGGLLGRGEIDSAVMKQHNIPAIDLVVVNLYPFKQTIQSEDVTIEKAIENIDIGGPTMLRAAAKNYHHVTVVCNPHDYADIMHKLTENNGQIDFKTRFTLACKVFAHTAAYEDSIANYLGSLSPQTEQPTTEFPTTINFQFHKAQKMRYGENPHQKAALYIDKNTNQKCIANMRQLQGKVLSYNNIVDADAALKCLRAFDRPSCVIVKHANPCGVACSDTLEQAYSNAFNTDPISAFGGIIACNRSIDKVAAQAIIQQFVEVIIAPEITESALTVFAEKPNIRILICDDNSLQQNASFEFKTINGGVLLQAQDNLVTSPDQLQVVTKRAPSDQELNDLSFAWEVVKQVKSNAIVYAKNNRTLGIGAGQMSRIFSAKIAIEKATEAKLDIAGSVMASDAFFPFKDAVEFAHNKGITAIIQPGGAMRDQAVIDAANQNNIAMVFTGTRHFKH